MLCVAEEEGAKLTRKYICRKCGGELAVAWGGAYGLECPVLICPHNPDHIQNPEDLKPQRRVWAIPLGLGK